MATSKTVYTDDLLTGRIYRVPLAGPGRWRVADPGNLTMTASGELGPRAAAPSPDRITKRCTVIERETETPASRGTPEIPTEPGQFAGSARPKIDRDESAAPETRRRAEAGDSGGGPAGT